MRLGTIATALLLGSALVAPIQADVLHFTNGTFMSVEGHVVEGDMVQVRLKGGASMSFPKRLVERIEAGNQSIFPNRVTTNVVESGSSGASTPGVVSVQQASAGGRGQAGGSAHRSASARRQAMKTNDPAALLGYGGQQQPPDQAKPYEHSRAAGLRKVSFTGNTSLLNRSAQDGSNLGGGKQVLQDPSRAQDPLRKAHMTGKRSAPPPPPPAESKSD